MANTAKEPTPRFVDIPRSNPLAQAGPVGQVIGGLVQKVLTKQDVPIAMPHVQPTVEKIVDAVSTAVVNKGVAVVPIVPASTSKINITAILTPLASVAAMVGGYFGLNFTPAEIIAVGAAVQTIGSFLIVVYRTFFTKSVTPQSVK